jgi:hypothetical protein
VKQISIFIVGLTAAFAIFPAAAEDLTAGKSAAQLFRSDCGECHRSPNGLVKDRDVAALTNFLREHYTTRGETAGALAAYVAGLAGSGWRSRAGAASDGDGDIVRRTRDDGDQPRPPGRVGTASAKPNGQTRSSSRAHEADGPNSRLRSYLSTGLDSNGAREGKTGAPKARKHRDSTVDAQGAKSKTDDAPSSPATAAPQPSVGVATPPAGGPVEPAPAAPAVAPAEEAPAAPPQ